MYEIERGRASDTAEGLKGGSCVIREHVADVYRQRRLGRADDVNEAVGREVLSFSDALRLGLDEKPPTQAPSSPRIDFCANGIRK